MLDRPIAILVVDDHPVVRDGIAAQLGYGSDIEITGLAGTADEAVELCRRDTPDVVLLDLRLPEVLAPELVPRLLRASPRTRVVIFTAFPEHAAVAPALAAGASGLIVKDVGPSRLREAIKEVVRTGRLADPEGTPELGPVTPREYDVLRLVAAGNTNNEIATELHLSPNTVKAYLHSVMHKLGARNRAQAITVARARGLL